MDSWEDCPLSVETALKQVSEKRLALLLSGFRGMLALTSIGVSRRF
jgi:hypothetical protein